MSVFVIVPVATSHKRIPLEAALASVLPSGLKATLELVPSLLSVLRRLPDTASHKYTVAGKPLSAPASMLPSGLYARLTTRLPNVFWRVPVLASHKRTLSPYPPVAIVVPLGLNVTLTTGSSCSGSVFWRVPVATFHSSTVPRPPAAIMAPLGLKATL